MCEPSTPHPRGSADGRAGARHTADTDGSRRDELSRDGLPERGAPRRVDHHGAPGDAASPPVSGMPPFGGQRPPLELSAAAWAEQARESARDLREWSRLVRRHRGHYVPRGVPLEHALEADGASFTAALLEAVDRAGDPDAVAAAIGVPSALVQAVAELGPLHGVELVAHLARSGTFDRTPSPLRTDDHQRGDGS